MSLYHIEVVDAEKRFKDLQLAADNRFKSYEKFMEPLAQENATLKAHLEDREAKLCNMNDRLVESDSLLNQSSNREKTLQSEICNLKETVLRKQKKHTADLAELKEHLEQSKLLVEQKIAENEKLFELLETKKSLDHTLLFYQKLTGLNVTVADVGKFNCKMNGQNGNFTINIRNYF